MPNVIKVNLLHQFASINSVNALRFLYVIKITVNAIKSIQNVHFKKSVQFLEEMLTPSDEPKSLKSEITQKID
jgi:hypothetical protein